MIRRLSTSRNRNFLLAEDGVIREVEPGTVRKNKDLFGMFELQLFGSPEKFKVWSKFIFVPKKIKNTDSERVL
jgi:hypothetical protein